MKNRYTLLSSGASGALRLGGILLALCWFVPVLSAQNASLAEQVGDLSSKAWKRNTEISSTINTELTNTDLALAQPALQAADKAMYLAYKRIVLDVQANAQGTVDKSIEHSYKQLMEDYSKDPSLKDLSLDGLRVLLQGLVESLTAAPVVEMPRY
jgi:hypothetical protein